MLFWCFLDESSDGQQKEAFVAAGFIAPPKTWASVVKPWKAKLRERRIRYFKSSECRNLQGQFWKYKNEFGLEEGHRRADAVRDELEQIVQPAEIFGFAMGIDLKAFREIDQLPESSSNKYWSSDYFVLAYRMTFYQIVAEVSQSPLHHYVAFVCDKSDKKKNLDEAFENFKHRYPDLAEHMRGISHLDDEFTPELQIADLMADVGRRQIAAKLVDPGFEIIAGLPAVRFDCLQRRGMLDILEGRYKGA